MTTIIHTLYEFEEQVRQVLLQSHSEKEIVNKIQPYFQSLLETQGLIPTSYKQPNVDKYRQFLLYKPKDEAFSIVSFVWGPGQTAPIHDHLVWGLVGIYEGSIEETRYRKIYDATEESDYNLEIVDTVIAEKNDISFVYPPNADIHSVRNPFKDLAITIHIYGTDIGKQERHRYDNETYAINPIITTHENETAIYPSHT